MSNPLHKPVHKHLLDEDVISAATDRQPSMVRDKRQAQMILRECSGDSGQSVYDHMAAMIRRILDERPPHVIDYFEDFSREVREERTKKMHENLLHLRATYVESERMATTRLIYPALTIPPPEDFPGSAPPRALAENDEEDETGGFDPAVVDVEHLQFYWSLAGYGFPAGQVFILSCCIQKLRADNPSVISARFWGQIYGLEKNYFVVEAELSAEAIEARATVEQQVLSDASLEFEKRIADRSAELDRLNELPKLQPTCPTVPEYPEPPQYPRLTGEVPPVPKLPRSLHRPKREIPFEVSGTGVNRKTYFVCNQLGETWIELPPVTPQQIQISRQIRKFVTGNLEETLWSHPVFPGVEKNYLRAMIARITAATYVAPIGYYRVGGANDEEEEEVDEEGDNDNDKLTSVDPGYEPFGAKELLLAQSWTHYRPNVLKQGRINWFDPKSLENKNDEEAEEEAEEEEDEVEDKEEEKAEVGPGLLSPCSEDVGKLGVWLTRMAQTYNPSQSMVVIRSNIWPGAFSFAQLRNHDSLYVGWGLKTVERNFSPISIPGIESEYPIGPEVMEIADPSVEEEDEWRAKQEKHDEEEGEEENMDEEGVEDNDDED